MPWSAPRVCPVLGHQPYRGDRCPACWGAREAERKRQYDASRPSAAQRGYGHAWTCGPRQDARALYGDHCALCGRLADPPHFDHILPRDEGGSDDPDNLRPLCGPCHSRRHAFGRV